MLAGFRPLMGIQPECWCWVLLARKGLRELPCGAARHLGPPLDVDAMSPSVRLNLSAGTGLLAA